MASEGLRGKTLTLKLKETNFEVRTRNTTLTRHISSREDIFREALKLLRAEMPITIRLMVSLGVRHILGSFSSQDPLAGCEASTNIMLCCSLQECRAMIYQDLPGFHAHHASVSHDSP